MARVRALEKADFRLASRVVGELGHSDITYEALQRLVGELRPLFAADDVAIAINRPRSDHPVHLWFRGFGADRWRRFIERSGAGHIGFRLFRKAGLRTARISDVPREDPDHLQDLLESFREESGLTHHLITHLGTRPHESLGRVTFYRTSGRDDFDDDRVALLRMLHPHLSRAFRRLIEEGAPEDGSEHALINASGQLLWMSEGFRFLWNAAESSAMGYGELGIRGFLDGSLLGRTVAYHVISLAMPEGSYYQPAPTLTVPFREGRGELLARFTRASGETLGCRGRVLRIALEHDAAEQTQVGTLAG